MGMKFSFVVHSLEFPVTYLLGVKSGFLGHAANLGCSRCFTELSNKDKPINFQKKTMET